jgi:hypothetical protein
VLCASIINSVMVYIIVLLWYTYNNVMFPLLIVLTVLGSYALYLSIINSVINCESFQVITLEVTTPVSLQRTVFLILDN